MDSKARRRKFLDILCASLGIENPADSRRGDAAQAYIDFGEEQCLEWLLKARGDIRVWEELAGIKQARALAQAKAQEKDNRKASQRKNAEHRNAIRNVAFLKRRRDPYFEELCLRLGIVDRADWRRDFVALAIVTHGRRKCSEWLEKSGDDFGKWEGLVDIKELPAIIRTRKSNSESELAKSRHRERVTASVLHNDSIAELTELRHQLKDELSKGTKASQFLLAGLRARIAELSAETGTPKV